MDFFLSLALMILLGSLAGSARYLGMNGNAQPKTGKAASQSVPILEKRRKLQSSVDKVTPRRTHIDAPDVQPRTTRPDGLVREKSPDSKPKVRVFSGKKKQRVVHDGILILWDTGEVQNLAQEDLMESQGPVSLPFVSPTTETADQQPSSLSLAANPLEVAWPQPISTDDTQSVPDDLVVRLSNFRTHKPRDAEDNKPSQDANGPSHQNILIG